MPISKDHLSPSQVFHVCKSSSQCKVGVKGNDCVVWLLQCFPDIKATCLCVCVPSISRQFQLGSDPGLVSIKEQKTEPGIGIIISNRPFLCTSSFFFGQCSGRNLNICNVAWF